MQAFIYKFKNTQATAKIQFKVVFSLLGYRNWQNIFQKQKLKNTYKGAKCVLPTQTLHIETIKNTKICFKINRYDCTGQTTVLEQTHKVTQKKINAWMSKWICYMCVKHQ